MSDLLHAPVPLTPGSSPSYPLSGRFYWLQSRQGLFGEEGKIFAWLLGSQRPQLSYNSWYVIPTPWSRVLPEKLTNPQMLKKFPAFYGTRMFITAFTRARQQWSILISHLRLSLPSGLRPSGGLTKTLYASLLRATCSSYLILLWFDHPNDIWWGVQIIKPLVMQSWIRQPGFCIIIHSSFFAFII
jgi:hypothetical protein